MSTSRPLVTGILAAALAAIIVAFVGGIFYGLWLSGGPAHTPFGVHEIHKAFVAGPIVFGFAVVVLTLPAVVMFAFGIGLPVFYILERFACRGIVAYIIGGIATGVTGASVITLAHTLSGFLLSSDYLFALCLVAFAGPIGGLTAWWVREH